MTASQQYGTSRQGEGCNFQLRSQDLTGLAVLTLAMVLFVARPKRSHVVRRVRSPRGPEGPAHPYRRAAPRDRDRERASRAWVWKVRGRDD